MSGCEGQVKEIFNCMTAVTYRPTLFFLHHFILFHIHSLFFFFIIHLCIDGNVFPYFISYTFSPHGIAFDFDIGYCHTRPFIVFI